MLNNEFPPLGGGTGTVNQALLERLSAASGLEIDLVSSAPGKEFEHQQFAEHIRIYRLPVKRFNIHHASNKELILYGARAFRFALKQHLSQPYDLCMAWSAVPAGGTALALRRLAGLRYIVRVCGPDIPGFEERYGYLYPLLTPVIKSIWRGAETVVAKCAGEAEMIYAVDPQARVRLVPNGVDLSAFKPADSFSESPLRLLCVARLIERKGQAHLIQAVRNLADQGVDVTLDLIGEGDAKFVLQELTQRLDIAGRVHFLGYVPRQQIADHYTAAHVFVLPSYNEGMSVATLEAMASGLPVVTTRTGGTVELVQEGANGFTFDWADVKSLTTYLHRLAGDREMLRRMGAASRQRAGMFSWENAARQYRDLFEKLASPPHLMQAERAS